MVTFLSGGTGTPKLLDGAGAVFSPEEIRVVANTGDDIELGGLFVSPDIDTLLFQGGGVLDRERWWGIRGDTHRTHAALTDIAKVAELPHGPQYLPEDRQTAGREIANWRRFSGIAEFMTIGDRDRAVHLTRTSLLDQGHTLSEVTATLADGFGLTIDILPMSDDPVASLIHTDDGLMHFQEYWVGHRGEPTVANVEFRGSSSARATPAVLEALEDTVVIGPSNPVTSIGPMLALPGVAQALNGDDGCRGVAICRRRAVFGTRCGVDVRCRGDAGYCWASVGLPVRRCVHHRRGRRHDVRPAHDSNRYQDRLTRRRWARDSGHR